VKGLAMINARGETWPGDDRRACELDVERLGEQTWWKDGGRTQQAACAEGAKCRRVLHVM
jgi:hypothetical protein